MKLLLKFLIAMVIILKFCASYADAQTVQDIEDAYNEHCKTQKDQEVSNPIKNQPNSKLEYIVHEQNRHLIKTFLKYQIEDTSETNPISYPNIEPSKLLLNSTIEIYKKLFPSQMSVFKAFIDTVYRHILDLALFTSNPKTKFYKLNDMDQGNLIGALEECSKITNATLKFYFDQCNEKVLVIGCTDDFICPEPCPKNITSFDPILKTFVNIINTISNHCFYCFEKPKTQLLHAWKLAMLDLITEQAKLRWSYNNEKLTRWYALLGPTFKTNMDVTTAVAKYMVKNTNSKLSAPFEGIPYNVQLLGTISYKLGNSGNE